MVLVVTCKFIEMEDKERDRIIKIMRKCVEGFFQDFVGKYNFQIRFRLKILVIFSHNDIRLIGGWKGVIRHSFQPPEKGEGGFLIINCDPVVE